MSNKIITVYDNLQTDYSYELTAKIADFPDDFNPDLSPKQMLEMGVFGGSYFDPYQTELPDDWMQNAKLSHSLDYDIKCNYFEVKASQPLKAWQDKGWIYEEDPRGWFQWYCRYYLGRRIPEEDERQIKRWRAIRRHVAQLKKYCKPGDLACRRRQRQALLHWAYDSTKL